MCRALDIHPGGLYGWLKQPESKRAIEDKRLLRQIKQFWMESGFSYGYRNITLDMKDQGESCGKNRVKRIMREAGIRSQRGYKRHRGFKGGDESQKVKCRFIQIRGFNILVLTGVSLSATTIWN